MLGADIRHRRGDGSVHHALPGGDGHPEATGRGAHHPPAVQLRVPNVQQRRSPRRRKGTYVSLAGLFDNYMYVCEN